MATHTTTVTALIVFDPHLGDTIHLGYRCDGTPVVKFGPQPPTDADSYVAFRHWLRTLVTSESGRPAPWPDRPEDVN